MRRIDQYLANLGYCSRRQARAWVTAGRVTVAGAPARDPGQKADGDAIRVDGEPLDHPEGLLILLHKPVGCVCSHDPGEGPSIYDLLPDRWRRRNPAVNSVGRLDKSTSGLLILTDRSKLVHLLTSPRHQVRRVYRFTVDRDLPADVTKVFASGTLKLENERRPCAPATLRPLGPRQGEIVLTEGRYHEVRRMLASQGGTVLTLHRIRFGNLDLGDLPVGQIRELPLDYFDTPTLSKDAW